MAVPGTDGGRMPSAGIAPADPSMLEAFLDEHADAPGYEITYARDGTARTRLLHDATVDAATLERPAAGPMLRCTPVAPGRERFTVRIDAVELLAVVEPQPALYVASAATAVEEATGLRRLSEANPRAVPLTSLLALLDREDEDPSRDRSALQALRRVAAVRPEDCQPAIPILQSLLEREALDDRADALAVLRAVSEDDPGADGHLTEA